MTSRLLTSFGNRARCFSEGGDALAVGCRVWWLYSQLCNQGVIISESCQCIDSEL